MKRQERYPDTNTFHYHNANPKNRLTGDCIFRAISTASGISWQDIVMMYYNIVVETGYDDDKTINILLERLNWVKCRQPRKENNTKYTGSEFCTYIAHPDTNYIANIGFHHIVAIIDKKIYDTWDSSDGCIGYYWVKE